MGDRSGFFPHLKMEDAAPRAAVFLDVATPGPLLLVSTDDSSL